jgi:endonuclease I
VALADAHPDSPNDTVLDIYANAGFPRQLAGTRATPRYDREHVWPKSLGFPDDRAGNAAYSDVHHLFAALNTYNSSRSNKPLGCVDPESATRRPTEENLGRGGGLTPEPLGSNYSGTLLWQTWIGRRGDVARAVFYMDIRYEGGESEADLKLVDEVSEISAKNVWRTGGTAKMGLLKCLLLWHAQDPVDDIERRRNTVVYFFQGNRNPFIDHPEWVGIIYGETP